MRSRTLAPALLAALLVTAAAAPAAADRAPKLHGGNFFSNCRFSHVSNDDPIVYPGEPGRSHSHTFFGNVSTNAASTPATLRGARSTCSVAGDRAAYWVPTLYQLGREVRPAKGQFYYVLRGFEEMHPFPAGLRMIAGDADATSPQPAHVTRWACGASGVHTRVGAVAPSCGVLTARFHGVVRQCATCPIQKNPTVRVQTRLELQIDFPDCWDGKRLDSTDHRSHMAYSRGYVCPRSHPVKVPLIRLNLRYPITAAAGVSLASGGQFSAHADFVNAWDQRALAKLVDDCFRGRPCNDPRAARKK